MNSEILESASTLDEVRIVSPTVFRDERGFFVESYNQREFHQLGITEQFVQDNHSRSVRNTLRGLHIQIDPPQAKLVRVTAGEILDVAVDVRPDSPSFAQWTATRLSGENFLQCYVPVGFAHGFLVLSDWAEVQYKCTSHYNPAGEMGIAWNDSRIDVEWPTTEPILSARDSRAPPLADIMDLLPRYTVSVTSS